MAVLTREINNRLWDVALSWPGIQLALRIDMGFISPVFLDQLLDIDTVASPSSEAIGDLFEDVIQLSTDTLCHDLAPDATPSSIMHHNAL